MGNLTKLNTPYLGRVSALNGYERLISKSHIVIVLHSRDILAVRSLNVLHDIPNDMPLQYPFFSLLFDMLGCPQTMNRPQNTFSKLRLGAESKTTNTRNLALIRMCSHGLISIRW